MFCTRCGTRLDDAVRFCSNCGKPVSEPNVPPVIPALPAYPGETKRLRRIMQDKKIAGVCAGYAEYFGMDVTLMRLIWVGLLVLPPSIGLIAYIVSWIVLPKE